MVIFMLNSQNLTAVSSSKVKVISGERLHFTDFMSAPYTTVIQVLSGHSKIGKTKILMTNGSLMKVESFAECSECSPWSILHTLNAPLGAFCILDLH